MIILIKCPQLKDNSCKIERGRGMYELTWSALLSGIFPHLGRRVVQDRWVVDHTNAYARWSWVASRQCTKGGSKVREVYQLWQSRDERYDYGWRVQEARSPLVEETKDAPRKKYPGKEGHDQKPYHELCPGPLDLICISGHTLCTKAKKSSLLSPYNGLRSR